MNIPKFRRPSISFNKTYDNIRESERLRKTRTFIEHRPFTSFFITLGILFGLILLGSFINSLSKEETEEPVIVKEVSTYTIGEAPKVSYQAQVEKAGVVQIIAQSPGVVQQINVKEGQQVGKGQTLVSLSTNYQGGNAPGLQAQLANAQLKNVKETYDTQKELINKQRQVADKTSANAEELRKIQNNSVDDIQSSVDINNEILTSLRDTLTGLEATNVGGANDALILQTKQGIAAVQGGLLQLNGSLESAKYQGAEDKPPADLADLQKDITLKQLDVQEKALELTKTSAQIQANLAGVNAALMYPASPCSGTVEKIHVKKGELVQPGTVIATIGGISDQITAEVLVPREIALSLSRTEPSTITIGQTSVEATPYYISSDATDGQLYSAKYTVPEGNYSSFTDGEFVPIDLVVSVEQTGNIPFIPIDSVYQTQTATYVYVVRGDTVTNKEITIGGVFGEFAEVTAGLTNGDSIILTRNVVAGEKVKITK